MCMCSKYKYVTSNKRQGATQVKERELKYRTDIWHKDVPADGQPSGDLALITLLTLPPRHVSQRSAKL